MNQSNEIFLINIFGDDKTGLTSSVTEILASSDVTILDIGQAVIHDSLSLGILVEVPPSANSSPILKDILFKTHELGVSVRFTPVSETEYSQWVGGQGKPRHMITLLARIISAEHISAITKIIARCGLNIDRIDRLSGRVPLDHNPAQANACVEFSIRGAIDDPVSFRAELMELCSRFDIDIAIQEDNMFRRNRRIVVFDMDSTLIEAEVIDELAKAADVGDEVARITEEAMQGKIDFTQSFKQRVALLKGLDESVLQGIAENLPITEGAHKLVSTLRTLGYKTAILSGGFTYFGNYLKDQLGMDYVYANELEIQDGKVTGQTSGIIVDGQRKAELLREIAAKEDVSLEQVIAVGDGANDLPMLSIAGLGIAFRAKAIVKESAKQAISTLGLDSILYLLGIGDRHSNHHQA